MKTRGFTLIELLVVISIIGVLSSIVLASLNAARAKGAEAALKANLRNMIAEAELIYDSASPNSYSGVCAGIADMISAIGNIGATSSCYSFDGSRWGVSARLVSSTFKNWAVDSSGVVTWDAADTGSNVNWDTANTACTGGGRLPTLEQLKALNSSYGGATPPFTFQNSVYWSGTADPNNSANAYRVGMHDGGVVNSIAKTNAWFVRCVR